MTPMTQALSCPSLCSNNTNAYNSPSSRIIIFLNFNFFLIPQLYENFIYSSHYTTLNIVFNVTYYLELHDAIFLC